MIERSVAESMSPMHRAALGQCEISELPSPTWVDFEVHRPLAPVVVWDSGGLPDPLQWAWCMPLEGEASAFDTSATRCAMAERYGGMGVGNNGGGAGNKKKKNKKKK